MQEALLKHCERDWTPRAPLTKAQLARFNKNTGLVNLALNNFCGHLDTTRGKPEDYKQVGYLALMEACVGFKPELGFKFSTYATKLIWSRVWRFANRYSKSFIVPYRLAAKDLPPEVSVDALGATNLLGWDEHYAPFIELSLDLQKILTKEEWFIVTEHLLLGKYHHELTGYKKAAPTLSIARTKLIKKVERFLKSEEIPTIREKTGGHSGA